MLDWPIPNTSIFPISKGSPRLSLEGLAFYMKANGENFEDTPHTELSLNYLLFS